MGAPRRRTTARAETPQRPSTAATGGAGVATHPPLPHLAFLAWAHRGACGHRWAWGLCACHVVTCACVRASTSKVGRRHAATPPRCSSTGLVHARRRGGTASMRETPTIAAHGDWYPQAHTRTHTHTSTHTHNTHTQHTHIHTPWPYEAPPLRNVYTVGHSTYRRPRNVSNRRHFKRCTTWAWCCVRATHVRMAQHKRRSRHDSTTLWRRTHPEDALHAHQATTTP